MEKKEIRSAYKLKRRTMTNEERISWSSSIIDHCLENLELKGKQISIFLPIERLREVLTWNLLEEKAHFAIPVVKEDRKLVHIRFEGRDQLEESTWGIPEPTYGEELDPKDFDLVFVPLLAVDSDGHRVGYGGGFYDAFLATCHPNCEFVGLSYFEPIEPITDRLTTDIPLDSCVTPKGVVHFSSLETS